MRGINRGGFTLIEMLVVLAIIGVITGIMFSSQSSFNKSLVLANTAYDIALTIRSAETFGLGSRASGNITNVGYGVHFTKGNSFILFADTDPSPNSSNCHNLPPSGNSSAPDAKPGDCKYTVGNDSLIQTYTIGNGMTVSGLCADSTCSISSLDIVFARPNPDAFIRANGVGTTAYSKACITITSSQGGSHYITVTTAGQINASASSCS